MQKSKEIKQGDVWIADLSVGYDSEQRGVRPVLVIQNDYLNSTSNNVVVVPITSQSKKKQPFHYVLNKENYPFFTKQKNTILPECVCHISKNRLERKLGMIFAKDMLQIIDILQYVFKEKK